jgi:DNA ligase-associated metallophosphoesterase
MMSGQTITLQNERLTLLPEHALFWERKQSLIVADLHLGKAATFRAAGIPVPGGTTTDNLTRLSHLLTRTKARRLIILGDLIHARAGRSEGMMAAVAAWRAFHAEVNIVLVRGNHDAWAGDPGPEWRIICVNEPLLEPPFSLCHYPEESSAGYTLAGHLHPAVILTGLGRQREKLPCFFFGARVGILPAFGSFTGTAIITPQTGDEVYVVAEDEIIRMIVR